MNIFFYETPIGKAAITDNGKAVTGIFFKNEKIPDFYEINETPIIKEAYGQLTEYFDGKRTIFNLPLDSQGTEFEKRVWDALLSIPYGEVKTYAYIADQIGKPKACRAVGRACGRNPISIVVPCHRVIGSNGKLTGFASGIDNKRFLLELENALH